MDLNKQPKNAAKQTGSRSMPVPQVQPLGTARKEEPKVQTPMRVIDAAIDASKAAHAAEWANLEVVLNAALDVAYSENLPADYPGKERTVEVRRRHWMYMAAVSFATYNPVLALDEEAVPEAVALAHDLMVERDIAISKQADKDNRARRMNGLPPTADTGAVATVARQQAMAKAALHKIASPPVDDERSADVKDWTPALEAGVLKAMDTLAANGSNFTDAHVEKNPRLKIAAAQYARKNPANKNEWLGSVQSKMDVRPQFAAASLSVGQARGVLNVWMSRRKAGR